MTEPLLVKLAQDNCQMHGRCPHPDYCLDQHRCKTQFPPVVLAEDMHRECVRDGWQMAQNPWVKRGGDHG